MDKPPTGGPGPAPDTAPEPPDIDWDQHATPAGGAEPATVSEAMLALIALGAGPQSALSTLHEQGFATDAPVADVPVDLWKAMLRSLSPTEAATMAKTNHFFHQLVHQLDIPLADATDPQMVHAYTAEQLTTAATMTGVRKIVVHAGIAPAHIGATAPTIQARLLLGPGVTATGITDGYIYVYHGATATNISDGYVYVYQGGTATNISGGEVHVHDGATATGISGGDVSVGLGSTATGITGGKVYAYEGGTATGITGGDVTVTSEGTATGITGGKVTVRSGGTATGITGGEVTVYPGGTATGITGGEVTVYQGGTATDYTVGTVTYWDGENWISR